MPVHPFAESSDLEAAFGGVSWHLRRICCAVVYRSTHTILAPTRACPTPTGASATFGALPAKVARNARSHQIAAAEWSAETLMGWKPPGHRIK
jgi:hypothetical protein